MGWGFWGVYKELAYLNGLIPSLVLTWERINKTQTSLTINQALFKLK